MTFTVSISDRAGNVTIGNSDNRIIHIDEVLPVLTNLSISSNNIFGNKWATKSDAITISFRSSEGLSSPLSIISSDSVVQTFSEGGTEWSGIYTVKEQDSDGLVDYSVTFADSAGNIGGQVTETTDGTKIIIDNTPPEIKNLREGANELDIPYYNIADSITLYWQHEDTTSGIRESFYALGSDLNNADINDWASVADDNYGGWSNLSLTNNSKYFGGAFTRDSVGNYSDTIWGDGITIDTEIPDTGSIIDGYWLIDLDQTPDSTRLSYRWSDFSDNVGIDYFQLAIGTYEDSTNILNWTRTDSTDSLTIRGLSLQKNILYNTYIKAVDLASNKSRAQKTDGVYFDNSVPSINAINPDFFADTSDFLSVLHTDTIKIKFNRPLYSYSLEAKSRLQMIFSMIIVMMIL